MPRMRPRCSIFTSGFDVSAGGDCTCCPPVERAEISKSEPRAIVRGIPCICGLYKAPGNHLSQTRVCRLPARARTTDDRFSSSVDQHVCGKAPGLPLFTPRKEV